MERTITTLTATDPDTIGYWGGQEKLRQALSQVWDDWGHRPELVTLTENQITGYVTKVAPKENKMERLVIVTPGQMEDLKAAALEPDLTDRTAENYGGEDWVENLRIQDNAVKGDTRDGETVRFASF